MSDNPFIDLAPCPDCESEVHVRFYGDNVQLDCTGCGRSFGVGASRDEARALCTYWNMLLGGPGHA